MAIVRIFFCVGTIMAAAFYNQTTLFYNQANTLSFAFIQCEQSEWGQCYFCDKKGETTHYGDWNIIFYRY